MDMSHRAGNISHRAGNIGSFILSEQDEHLN